MFTCICDFLTDMDGTSLQRVEVCGSTLATAEEIAVGCAQTGAPATIQRCRCTPLAGRAPCKAKHCAVSAER